MILGSAEDYTSLNKKICSNPPEQFLVTGGPACPDMKNLRGEVNSNGWYVISQHRGSMPGLRDYIYAAKHIESDGSWYVWDTHGYPGDALSICKRVYQWVENSIDIPYTKQKGSPIYSHDEKGADSGLTAVKFVPVSWLRHITCHDRGAARRKRKEVKAYYIVLQANVPWIRGMFSSQWIDLVGIHQGHDYYEMMDQLFNDRCGSRRGSMDHNVIVDYNTDYIREFISHYKGEDTILAVIGRQKHHESKYAKLRLIKRKTRNGTKVQNRIDSFENSELLSEMGPGVYQLPAGLSAITKPYR